MSSGSSRGRGLKRLALGEAGLGPALVVAGVAVVVAFISVAGARLLLSADNTATGQALAQMPVLDAGIVVSANPPAIPVGGVLSAVEIARIGSLMQAGLLRRQDFRANQSFATVLMPNYTVAIIYLLAEGTAGRRRPLGTLLRLAEVNQT